MVSLDDVKAILADCSSMGVPAEIDDDTPIVVDSFALVWIKHLLEERHQVVVAPTREDMESFTSAAAIHAYLTEQTRVS